MSDLPPLDRATVARRAASLLTDEVLIGALDELERQCGDAWGATGLADVTKRESSWHLLKASHRLRAYLVALVDDGKIVAARTAVQTPVR